MKPGKSPRKRTKAEKGGEGEGGRSYRSSRNDEGVERGRATEMKGTGGGIDGSPEEIFPKLNV